jgi:outer membrane protein assembly factor BamC
VQEVLPTVGNMRIERSGNQRWLVVPGAPDKLWSGIKEFWQELGFIINVELPEAGVMETDWAEDRAKIPQDMLRGALGKVLDTFYSTAERDKFRTRVEKGAQGETEIYISHRGMYEVYVSEGRSETRWQPRPADPELEAAMLRRLMVRFGMDEVRAKTLLADSGAKVEKAKLITAKGGAGTLEVQDAFDRAWRRSALDRVGHRRDRTSQGRTSSAMSTGRREEEGQGRVPSPSWRFGAASLVGKSSAIASGRGAPGASRRGRRGQHRNRQQILQLLLEQLK